MKRMHFLDPSEGKLPRVGRYELLAEIASGGMASVFLGRLVGIGGFQRLFAIKRMHPHLAKQTEFVNMFLDEARLVAGIRHPNVVPVLEVGADDGYYLVMEYIEGDMLAALLARTIKHGRTIPEHVVISMILDTLAGLHAAHEHVGPDGKSVHIVHRDVSPQNILVDLNGTTKITDFGIAHATSRLSSTRGGQLKGKVAYMAPEQARGAPDIDRRADVFAAAVVCWESLASRRLFMTDNEVATLNRLMTEPIPDLHEVNPKVPEDVAAVVTKGLERDPAKRYQNAAHMAQDLREAARKHGLLGTPADAAEFIQATVGQHLELRRQEVRGFLATLPTNVTEEDFSSLPSAVIKASQPGGMVPTPPVGIQTRSDVPHPPGMTGTPTGSSFTPGPFVPSPDTAALLLEAQKRSRKVMIMAIGGATAAALIAVAVIVLVFGGKANNAHAPVVRTSAATSALSTHPAEDLSSSATPPTLSEVPSATPASSSASKSLATKPRRTPGKWRAHPKADSTGKPVDPSIHKVEKNPYR